MPDLGEIRDSANYSLEVEKLLADGACMPNERAAVLAQLATAAATDRVAEKLERVVSYLDEISDRLNDLQAQAASLGDKL